MTSTLRLAACFLVAAVVGSARADLLPPAQDTSSSKGKLTVAAGKATTLAISATGKGYVYFDLDTLPAAVGPADVVSARLRVYFPSVTKAGPVELHAVTPAGTLWNETTAAAVEPGVGTLLGTFAVGQVVGKKFAELDVTVIVQNWLAGAPVNFGFVFTAAGLTKATIGAKEGPGSGYPCELEIEIERATTDGSVGSAQLADGAVTVIKLGAGAALANLANGSVVSAKLGSSLTLGGTTNGIFSGTFSGDGSGLTSLNIGAGIVDGSIANAKLVNAGYTVSAGTGLTGGGSAELGGTLSLSLGSGLTLGGTTTFSGPVLLPAGSATAAALRVQAGAQLTVPVFGAVEFDGTNLYLTNNSVSPTRKTVAFTDSAISMAQIASGAVGNTQLAPGLTLVGTTTGIFSGTLAGNATTADGFNGLLNGDVTGAQGATVVSTIGGMPAGTVAAGASLANAATSNNVAGALVKRDDFGTIVAGVIFADQFVLPVITSSGSRGVISQNGNRLLYGTANNIFVGPGAGNFAMTGGGNTGAGDRALQANISGVVNSALGSQALFSNTTGSSNTAAGNLALFSNMTGGSNTAVGTRAMIMNDSGSFNTASGYEALRTNTSGQYNSATGYQALVGNTTANLNTATGAFALFSNTTGDFNTATGSAALRQNVDGTNNTAHGASALDGNTSGQQNTATGSLSLLRNQTGSGNTATGYRALSSTTNGGENTASGAFALNNNVSGIRNTAEGLGTLLFNTSGNENTAGGYSALQSNTIGIANTADGAFALFGNTTGTQNVALGHSALRVQSFNNGGAVWAGNNVAVGFQALQNNQPGSITTGVNNTALGTNALSANTTGANNIAIGNNAGMLLTSGNDNIEIGHAGVAAETGTIRIGNGANQTRAFIAGIRGVTTGVSDAVTVVIDSTGQLGTISSSRRYKEDIADMGDASARLQALRPVTFHYKQPYANGEKPIQYGLIAEEVAETFPELAVFNAKGQPETVKYQDLTPLLLNEVQKLRSEKDALQKESAGLRTESNDLRTRLEKLEAAFEKLAK